MTNKFDFKAPSDLTNHKDVTEKQWIMLTYDSHYSPHPATFRCGTIMDATPERIRFRRNGENWYIYGTEAEGYEAGDIVKELPDGVSVRYVGRFQRAEVQDQ